MFILHRIDFRFDTKRHPVYCEFYIVALEDSSVFIQEGELSPHQVPVILGIWLLSPKKSRLGTEMYSGKCFPREHGRLCRLGVDNFYHAPREDHFDKTPLACNQGVL